MREYLAFVKKEWMEYIRTYKLLILVCVFFFFGMTSPFLAKITPEMLKSMDLQGMTINIPDATALDAYSQFFKNVTQMGLIVFFLVCGGTLSHEFSKGTLIHIVTKGLSRTKVMLAKFTMVSVVWTLSLALSALTNYGYTRYLFGGQHVDHIFYSMFCFWLFGMFLIAVLLLGSCLFSGSFGGVMVVAAVVFALFIFTMIPDVSSYLPITLASVNVDLLSGAVEVDDTIASVVITGLGTVLTMIASIAIFRKKIL